MEVQLFLTSQDWLKLAGRSDSSKRTRPTSLACKTSFHISLSEQYGNNEQQWHGAKASDAVCIRLQLPGGLVTSTLSADLAIQQLDDGSYSLNTEWFGSTYSIQTAGIIKVVCSPAIYSAVQQATLQQMQQQHHQGSCMLAAAANVDCQGLEFITIVRSHVCLDLFAQHTEESVAGLARVALFLHQSASCSQALPASAAVAAAPDNSSSTSSWVPPVAGSAELSQWLAGAACEAQVLQLLVDVSASREQLQQRHMLQAVAHMHASLQ